MDRTLELLSLAVIALSALSAAVTIFNLLFHPQPMWIMNLVWPLTALYAGPLGLAAYLAIGRSRGEAQAERPRWQAALVGATHCGAGCALGDFAGDWAAHLGALSLFGSKLMAAAVVDVALAYTVGIFFQYFSIAPMGGLTPIPGLVAAIKADTLSLVAYEAGMLAWMILVQLWLAPYLEPTRWAYWTSMQVAMLLGFATTYPVNWWLIRAGIKEAM